MAAKEVYCPKNDTPNIKELSQYIYTKLRITIEDKRKFIGYFMCIDKDKNIILSSSNEYTLKEEKQKENQEENEEQNKVENSEEDDSLSNYNSRFLGLIMIPGKYIKKVEAITYPYL
ncbi:hypothetical protein BCR32DRAFT_326187 [Anaeromyces robustus]|uniref:Sm domain-containing protein n=1 Tax=Anaeromyces robustus TaxID=1754192 RepID=A0A1Y1XEF8_9FUNG|nr:hypothetical protein BCR32DRAFT_326187 [Anaeromyces robustus]|eukprot:ORX83826.1 hypothetical protein BCR32DRAFT_326187 [Anaeromyces robustus]